MRQFKCMCKGAPHTNACLRSNGINADKFAKYDTLIMPKHEPTALELAFRQAKEKRNAETI